MLQTICHSCKTNCNANSCKNLTQKLFYGMSCDFGFVRLKLLKIDFFKKFSNAMSYFMKLIEKIYFK